MIISVGIDAVECQRFNHWKEYSHHQLSRVFAPEEISYSLSSNSNYAERFAVRFAAKEAFYKALCGAYPNFHLPFISICPWVKVVHTASAPELYVNWKVIAQKAGVELFPYKILLSLTHTKQQAIAIVILQ